MIDNNIKTYNQEVMMKKVGLILAISVLFVLPCIAKDNVSVSAYTGYTMTAYEDQDESSGTLSIGAAIGYMVSSNFEIGVNFTTALGGFSFINEVMGATHTITVTHIVAGVHGKYYLPLEGIKPYLKAGAGYFAGHANYEVETTGVSTTDTIIGIDGNIGFTVGAGIITKVGIFVGFDYNIVSRKWEGSDDSAGMNTWAVLLGYHKTL